MKELLHHVSQYNDLVLEGKELERLEDFYQEDAKLIDVDARVFQGKQEVMKELMNSVFLKEGYHCAKPLTVAIGEQTTMVEWRFVFDRGDQADEKDGVSIQHWHQGKIIKEKHYFKH